MADPRALSLLATLAQLVDAKPGDASISELAGDKALNAFINEAG
jgi:hypothetical protein